MGRPMIALVIILAALGGVAAGLAWLLEPPTPPRQAPRAERLYVTYCASCHGADGRGSWWAWLFLLRPGNLADPDAMARHSDQYLFELLKQGGAPLGRPGMPGFGFLPDEDLRALVAYVRALARGPRGADAGPAR